MTFLNTEAWFEESIFAYIPRNTSLQSSSWVAVLPWPNRVWCVLARWYGEQPGWKNRWLKSWRLCWHNLRCLFWCTWRMHFSKWNEKLSFSCSSLLPAAAQRLKQMISPFQAGFCEKGWVATRGHSNPWGGSTGRVGGSSVNLPWFHSNVRANKQKLAWGRDAENLPDNALL